MSKKYEKFEISNDQDDIKVIYQGVSYVTEDESVKVIVELSIDELETSESDTVEPTFYLIEVESVDAEILIEDDNFKLYLKQHFHYYSTKWKIKTTGLRIPEEKLSDNLQLSVVINLDERFIDIIFDNY